jgi:transposase
MDRAEAEAIYDAGRDSCVTFLLELTAGYERQIAELGERLARLEAAARQDSRTSSEPPSLDPPKTRSQRRAEARAKAKELMRREGEQRKGGGQSGHRGAGRELRPEDQIDEIVDHFPDACGGCGREFTSQQRRPRRRFGRHQICELPPISVIWTEHRTHQLRCRECLARTSARLPDGIATSAFGPRLQAAVVALTARHRVSRRGISELARDLFGVHLSTGAADAICQRASDALAGPHLQLQDWVLDQDAVHVDETGWRTRGEGRALWTATTPDAVFLQIAEHCNREQFNALIATEYAGIVISDRWNGYSHLDPSRRQACWSHIKRDFARHADGLAEQKTFGETGSELTRRVFAAWRAYQHDHHDRSRLHAEITPIQIELRTLLEQASPKKARNRWHRQFANNLLKIWPALWTFVVLEGIEPTNNPAERALRSPVIHRKLSLGSQSHEGERFAERALSAAGTCRLQHRSLFTYLSDLLVAHNRGDPFPALAT